MKITKRPVEVEAVRFTGSNLDEVRAIVGRRRFREVDSLPADELDALDPGTDAQVWDVYHSTWIGVRRGQWLIVGVNGETYPIEHDVLMSTYDVPGHNAAAATS